MKAEIEALVNVVDDLLAAAKQIAIARQEFDTLPPAATGTENETRTRLRAAMLENHLCMLMTPITVYAVLKKLAACDSSR
jgi:hypothetical protein